MTGINLYHRVQLRMGDWILAGLPMPIDEIGYGKSRDLLDKCIGKGHPHFELTAKQVKHLEAMLGPNGYAYYRVLLEQVGGFDERDRNY